MADYIKKKTHSIRSCLNKNKFLLLFLIKQREIYLLKLLSRNFKTAIFIKQSTNFEFFFHFRLFVVSMTWVLTEYSIVLNSFLYKKQKNDFTWGSGVYSSSIESLQVLMEASCYDRDESVQKLKIWIAGQKL